MSWVRNLLYPFFGGLVSIIVLFFIGSCAVIKPPSGGPKDTTPPFLVYAEPPSGTLQYKGVQIRLEFSEYMDESSIKKGIRVFPNVEGEISINTHGTNLTVDFPDNLEEDQTYVINLSRNIKDEHGVEMAEAIFLAYSTGDKIDNGSISGVVWGDGPMSVHLWRIIQQDSLENIFQTMPNYFTDVSNKGGYNFQFLSAGNYLLLALDRSAAGLALDTRRMKYGLFWQKIIALDQDQSITDVNVITKKEQPQLRLQRGEWNGNNWGRIIFSRSLNYLNDNYSVILTYDDGTIESPVSFHDPEDPNALILIRSDKSPISNKIRIKIENIFIDNDVFLDSASVSVVVPQDDENYIDLTEPKKAVTITPTAHKDTVYLELKFSEPIPHWGLEYELYKSDTISVNEKIVYINPMWVNILPHNNWEPRINYTLNIFASDSLKNMGGTLLDSVITVNIKTTDYQGYGGLYIPITGEIDSVLGAVLYSIENPEQKNLSFVNSQARLEFNQIREGKYTLTLFSDRNNDKTYTTGTAKPLTPAEWFYVMPDTIEVRTNWDIELPSLNIQELY